MRVRAAMNPGVRRLLAFGALAGGLLAGCVVSPPPEGPIDWSVRVSRTVDVNRALDRAGIDGRVERSGVSCSYPRGLAGPAATLVDLVLEARRVVREDLGCPWSFDVDLFIIPVDRVPDSYTFARRSEAASFPVFCPRDHETFDGLLAANADLLLFGLVHEVVEFSMMAPRDGRVAIGGGGPSFFSAETTRWLREGVASWAGARVHERLVGPIGLDHYFPAQALWRVGPAILEWPQGAGDGVRGLPADTAYQAALGLVRALDREAGGRFVPRLYQTLGAAGESPADGPAVRRAVELALGLDDLGRFIGAQRAPWLPIPPGSLRPLDYQSARNLGIPPHGLLYDPSPDAPVVNEGLRPGEVLVQVGSRPMERGIDLEEALAALPPGGLAILVVDGPSGRRTFATAPTYLEPPRPSLPGAAPPEGLR